MIASALLATALAGPGYFYTGNDLDHWCKHSESETISGAEDSYSYGKCQGYIVGVVDALQLANECTVPNGVTVGQLTKIVTKYMKSHTEELHRSAPFLVYKALDKAFTCGPQR